MLVSLVIKVAGETILNSELPKRLNSMLYLADGPGEFALMVVVQVFLYQLNDGALIGDGRSHDLPSEKEFFELRLERLLIVVYEFLALHIFQKVFLESGAFEYVRQVGVTEGIVIRVFISRLEWVIKELNWFVFCLYQFAKVKGVKN